MKVKLIIISIVLLLVMVFACGCIPFMEKLGLISPTNEEQLSPEKGGPPDGLVKVLIGFKEKPGAAQQAMVKGVGGKIKYTYNIVDAIAASIPEKAIDALQKNPNVTHVELDSKVYALDAELDNSWGVKHIGAGIVHDDGNKGTGIEVAIIDSGIDYTHLDLDDNYVGGYDFVNDDTDPMDDDGHGTHVAGTVAAEDNGSGVVGVAPEAKLYALKVLEGGSGYWSDIIAALEWCTRDDNNIQVTNNSYGSSGDPGDTVKAAFDNSASAGVLHVAAAGNSGNPPGIGDNVGYPAAYNSVIAVAATDQSDERARWSSTGLAVELAAPGVSIYSTLPGNSYDAWSGTSMASPHVAGVAALVIASGTTGVSVVRGKLQDTADDLGDPSLYGYGLVDADEAADVSLDTGNIKGKVTDEADAVIEGATVVVEGTNLSDTTDEGGYYLLENVPVGIYDVIASAGGYYSETATVTIVKDGIVTQDFTLQVIPTYLVSGTVTDAENLGLGGVTVTINETGQLAITGNDGTYAISDVKGSTYNITAVKEFYSSQTKTVIVKEDITVNFTLEEITEELQELHVNPIDMWYKSAGPNRFVSTKVEIVSSDGTAVSGATVYLETTLPDKSIVSGSGDIADDGTITFELKSRQTGTYTSTVTHVEKGGWGYPEDPEGAEPSKSIIVL